MKYLICLTILIIAHIVGDGLLQSREVAKNKSKNPKVLLRHLFFLSLPVFLVMLYSTQSFMKAYYFTLANACIHGIIDWNIWNGYAYLVYKRHYKKVWVETYLSNKGEDEMLAHKVTMSQLENFEKNKSYADDPWFYHFIVTDQALHILTFIGLLSTGVFL